MRITDATVTPNTVNTGELVNVVVAVTNDQGFITANKLSLKTSDGLNFIVKDS
jgi:hypothetical protein